MPIMERMVPSIVRVSMELNHRIHKLLGFILYHGVVKKQAVELTLFHCQLKTVSLIL